MAASSFFRRGAQLLHFITRESRGFDRVAEKIELTAFTEGHCTCCMVLGEEHTNHGGTIHGGFTATLVDLVTTIAIMSTGPQIPGVSVDMTVSYLRAARPGDEIIINATCIKAGKSLAFSKADIKLADGTILAHGQHTKFVGKALGPSTKLSEIKASDT
ncbi:acyl-coenzyme A thioesterase 13-like isoform X2 [Actinia tenebrosa]|uniref:Acyl-coenzyme A thioesterase 13 n=1 Tax=Actinia tenebrosa TaxID=6105 RepID=A0A6P8I467_ACTTE|nr:acyl-coenzyme A thioesterase 13-like isoform X2 [Actinia tenebrosa]